MILTPTGEINNLTWEGMEMMRMGFTQVVLWNGTSLRGKSYIPGGGGE